MESRHHDITKYVPSSTAGSNADLTNKNCVIDISFMLKAGEHLLITGASGSGKSTLAKAIAGKAFNKGNIHLGVQPQKIILVEQHYYFKTLSNTNDFYYQQRYNSFDSNDALTVYEELLKITDATEQIDKQLFQLNLLHRKQDSLLHLSSGEHKRFQLIKAFLQDASVYIFDSPFVGLDVNSRRNLKATINKKSETSTIIIIADVEDAPTCITHVAEVSNGQLKEIEKLNDYKKHVAGNMQLVTNHHQPSIFKGNIPVEKNEIDFDVAVKLENVNIAYGEKIILENISWQINRGERWLLKGANGSGKSTLLSLITGDHPQVYANKVFLFDKKRGSGESIWDIKKRIGFVSPELHWYFDKTISVYNTIASGFFDTVGVYKKLSEQQHDVVQQWLSFLQLEKKASFSLSALSTSGQRLVLLARALVKNPSLLILDEPCQGLDEQQVKDFVALVDALCFETGNTLIYVSHYENEIPACINKEMLLEEIKKKKNSINIKNKTAVAV
ncbi:MAG: ATP-binding cassette domain-containing protein [Bacteroidetes bacterium]|nr:ATP-binding cassette domain-containing protein [Bacteroidota bacterium]